MRAFVVQVICIYVIIIRFWFFSIFFIRILLNYELFVDVLQFLKHSGVNGRFILLRFFLFVSIGFYADCIRLTWWKFHTSRYEIVYWAQFVFLLSLFFFFKRLIVRISL